MPALSIADIKGEMTALDGAGQSKSIGLLDDTAAYPFDIVSLDELGTDRAQRDDPMHDIAKKLGELMICCAVSSYCATT